MIIVKVIVISSSSSSVFFPRAGPSLQTQAPRLQFCSKADLPLQTLIIRNCSGFYWWWIISSSSCVLPKGRSSTANSGTKVAVLLGMNRCGSFLLLSAPRSLFSIWTDLKRYKKIPGEPSRRWGQWIWLTGPSGLYRNSPQGLNISSIRVFDQMRDPEIPITLRSLFEFSSIIFFVFFWTRWCIVCRFVYAGVENCYDRLRACALRFCAFKSRRDRNVTSLHEFKHAL